MPKQKTSKTAAKRIKKITSSGKIIRKKTLAQHLVHRKSDRTIAQSGTDKKIADEEKNKIKRLIPYGVK
ncbi:MAG: 50S ribosomal protein L35 [candidate division WS2 bacterium ADurb.Bin280]|uniref:Large ribosomal subunit protein bL35 n=1 Tax=candidate division WS2 bacterium ADurb.Bin280 TaxID=1852829 RepID=A0A1V5SFJ8_9BACT|nr:MAG: 50S ribosomal protein L35 [candidate division WS2 bacterium ADurb.Bin280]